MSFVKRKVYYNSSKQVPQRESKWLYHYKPRESSLQREVLEELI